eukprot:559890-Amphidinium_carterae.1
MNKLGDLGFTSVSLFASADENKVGVRAWAKAEFGLDPAARPQDRLPLAALVDAWTSARTRTDKRHEHDAMASNFRQPPPLQRSELARLRTLFQERYYELDED